MEDIILLGIGGHAHSVVDSIERTRKYRIIGFLDTEEMKGKSYKEYPVLDTDDAMKRYFDNGVRNAFITIGYMGHGTVRKRLYWQLKEIGYALPSIIDETAIVSGSAKFGEGVFAGKKVVVNAGAEIGNMCILNTGSIIEHDCKIGDFSHIAVGAVLCGGVTLGEGTLIGANATIIQEKKIGSNCIIGAGTVISRDVKDNMVRYGMVEKQREVEGKQDEPCICDS